MASTIMGLLAGWKRRDASHGVVVTLQFVDGTQSTDVPAFSKIVLAIGDEQLCSLTRDLARAARERDLKVWAKKRPSILLGVDRLLERLLRPQRPLRITYNASRSPEQPG